MVYIIIVEDFHIPHPTFITQVKYQEKSLGIGVH
jgi:hypothetical protein